MTNPLIAFGADACMDGPYTVAHVLAWWWLTMVEYAAQKGLQLDPNSTARTNRIPDLHWATVVSAG